MTVPELRNWHVSSSYLEAYTPPELTVITVEGDVYGHPSRIDGVRVRTSALTSVDGRTITTRSRVYRLGDPSPEYRAYLAEHHPGWDADNPIKLRGVRS